MNYAFKFCNNTQTLFPFYFSFSIASVKSKEKKIDSSYEDRLNKINKSPAIEAINKSISLLAESQKVSRGLLRGHY